jgi:hypothetical protein
VVVVEVLVVTVVMVVLAEPPKQQVPQVPVVAVVAAMAVVEMALLLVAVELVYTVKGPMVQTVMVVLVVVAGHKAVVVDFYQCMAVLEAVMVAVVEVLDQQYVAGGAVPEPLVLYVLSGVLVEHILLLMLLVPLQFRLQQA